MPSRDGAGLTAFEAGVVHGRAQRDEAWRKQIREVEELARVAFGGCAGSVKAALSAVRNGVAPNEDEQCGARAPSIDAAPWCIEEDCTEDKAIGNERCGAHAAQFERDIARLAKAKAPCSTHGRRVSFPGGVPTCEACGVCLHTSKTVDLTTGVETCNDCAPTSGAVPAPVQPAEPDAPRCPYCHGFDVVHVKARQWTCKRCDVVHGGGAFWPPVTNAPAQPAGRSSSLADLGITTLDGAAFAYDTMRSQWVEVVDRLYAACAVVGVEASVLPGDAIVDAVKEAVGDLSTALNAPPGESWDALLGRVRGMVEERPVHVECSECQGFGFVPPDAPCDWCGGVGRVHPETLKTLQHLEKIRVSAQAAASAQAKAEPAPTLHLTAEDINALPKGAAYAGQFSMTESSYAAGYDAGRLDGARLGVEAAFAAVQSETVGHAVFDRPGGPWNMSVSDVLREGVTAARRIVKVPAKEEPAPAPPTRSEVPRCVDCWKLVHDEPAPEPPRDRERLAQVARAAFLDYPADGPNWTDIGPRGRADWARVVDAVIGEPAPARPRKTIEQIECGYCRGGTICDEHKTPAPPPPLPEVPAEIRRGAADPFDSFNILASYLVALDAALRARGGL